MLRSPLLAAGKRHLTAMRTARLPRRVFSTAAPSAAATAAASRATAAQHAQRHTRRFLAGATLLAAPLVLAHAPAADEVPAFSLAGDRYPQTTFGGRLKAIEREKRWMQIITKDNDKHL
jgi:hypothetical protein